MDAKFKEGQKVRVTKKNGEVITGVIASWDYNLCNYNREYDVNYELNGEKRTIICVPESAIEAI